MQFGAFSIRNRLDLYQKHITPVFFSHSSGDSSNLKRMVVFLYSPGVGLVYLAQISIFLAAKK